MLVDALIQAEADVKGLQADLVAVKEERDQYYRESRDSATTLGRIIGALRDDGLYSLGDIDDVPQDRRLGERPRRSGRPVEPKEFHRYDAKGSTGPYHLCVCGNQWLTQAGRCVAEGPKL